MKRFLPIVFLLFASVGFTQNYNSLNGPYGGGADKIIAGTSGRLLALRNGPGIFTSDDNGVTWVKSNTGLPYTYILDIFTDNSGKIYALFDNSIYASGDNGTNWTLLANTGFAGAVRMAQGPSGNLFIVSSNPGKVYRSTNGGTNWFERIQFSSSFIQVSDFEFTSTGKMLISTYGSGIYTTAGETDLAATAITTAQGLLTNYVYNIVQNGSNVYALTSAGPSKSVNSGATFSDMTTSLPSCCYYSDIMERDPSGILYLTHENVLYKSTDGTNWSTTITGPLPGAVPTYKSMYFSSASTFYLSVAGVGIYKTTTTGSSWTAVNNGLQANDLSNIVLTDNGRLLVSRTTGGPGIHMSTDDGVSWDFIGTGAMTKQFSGLKKIGSVIYAYGQGIAKSTDNASTWTTVQDGSSTPFLYSFSNLLSNDGVKFYTLDSYDYSTSSTTFGLWKSTNSGTSFSRTVVTGLPSSSLASFSNSHVVEMDSNGNIYFVLYTYSSGATSLYKIANGSTTAVQVTNSGISNIYDIQTNGAKLYVAGDGNKMAISPDAGATWSAKTIGGGFNQIKIIDDNTYYAFAGSIYLSTDAGVNWTNTGTVEANTNVIDVITSSANYAYVIANYGGAFKSKSSVIPPVAPTSLALLANGHDAVALEWSDNSNNELYFRVEASKGDNLHYDSVASATREDYQARTQGFSYVYGLTPGAKYYFRVKAVGPGGFSNPTNEVSVTMQTDCTADSDIPTNRSWTAHSLNQSGTNVPDRLNQSIVAYTGAPGDLFMQDIGIGVGNDLGLDDPVGADIINNCGQVFLNFDEAGGLEWIPNGQATWNTVTKTITIPIKTHPYYALRTETIVYTLNATDPVPAAPTNLTGGVYTTGSVLIGWTSTNFASKYEIERSTAVNTSYAKIAEVGQDVVSYKDLDASLVVGTKYFYRIRAVNSTGNSVYSNEINVTPSNAYNFDPFVNLPSKTYFTSSAGGAWGDVDGDGIEDLVIGAANDSLNNPIAPVIFKSDGTGKFSRYVIEGDVLEPTGDYRNVMVIDVNNDGLNDIFFTRYNNRDYLLLQNSDHTFSKTFAPYASGTGISASNWVDLDNDGDLDLVYCGDESLAADVKIYKNNGSGGLTAFTDSEITTAANGGTRDLQFADFDNDGLVDVLKINRQTASTQHTTLYRNTGGGNLKIVIGSAFETVRASHRTASWGDYDNDGDLDVFVGCQSTNTNFSNRLFKNNGDGTFSEVAGSAMTEQVLTYGSAWADIDNDTDLDLLITTSADNRIYFNNGNGTFTKSIKDELFTNPNMGKLYGLSMADINNDGFLDFYIGGFSGQNIPNFVFKNQNVASASKNWLKVKLEGTTSNRAAVGVRLKMVAGGKTLTRYVQSHTAFGTQSSLVQHFGIGSATTITSLTMYWPSGLTQTMGPINTVNQTITVIEDGDGPVATSLSPANDSEASDVTKLEITFNEEAFAVAGKKLHLTNTTDAAPTLDIDVSSGTKDGKKISFTVTKLIIGKEYQLAIDAGAFKDIYSNLSSAFTPDDWSFHTVEPVDSEAPAITFTPDDLSVLQQGFSPVSVPISVTDNKQVTGVKFYHRKITGEFESVDLGVNPTSFDVTPAMVDDMGMEFYFEATDGINTGRKPADDSFYRAVIQYSGSNSPTIQVPGQGTAQSWKIISIPYDLNSTLVSQIFVDLGTPAKNSWRLIRYALGADGPVWQEYPNSLNSIERGKGYFINAITAADVVLSDPKSPVYSQEKLFTMDLVQGWNQVGNPYNVTLNWDDILSYNGLGDKVKDLYLFSAGSYGPNSQLLKESGGFVFATEAASGFSFSFPGQAAGPARASSPNFGPIDSDNWIVNFKASNGDVKAPIGGVGMTTMSSNSYDKWDQFSPPRFINYLEFNFDHPEYFYPHFGRDVVATAPEHIWEFNIETNEPGLTRISWDKPMVGDSELQLYLYDIGRQHPVDMIAETTYTVDASKSSGFKVYYGRNVLSKIKPDRVVLGSSFPNPTAATATIPFSIPEANAKTKVRLEVFDLTGRKVGTLANGEYDPGFYSAEWYPNESAANGMYIYRLFAGDEILGGKIILRK